MYFSHSREAAEFCADAGFLLQVVFKERSFDARFPVLPPGSAPNPFGPPHRDGAGEDETTRPARSR